MELPNQQVQENQGDELSIKDLILKIREWCRYLVRKWKLIFLFALIGAAFGFAYAFFKEPKYTADLTFVLEDTKSSSLGAYAGLASQFGIDLSGAGESGIFTGDNIMEFLKSRLIVEKSLLSDVTVNGKKNTLAELYIETYDLRKKWNKKEALKNIQYPSGADRSKFSRQQDSLLNVLYTDILKKNLAIVKPDKKLAFISVSCSLPNETFAIAFTEKLVQEATDFYVATKTKKSRSNVDKLQAKADSIESLLNKTTFKAAVTQDLNLNPAKRIAMVSTELASRDKMVLQTMFGEVIKHLELAKMSMAQESPVIQIVDHPIFPLELEKVSKAKAIVAGGILGAILICLVLIIIRMYKSVMAS